MAERVQECRASAQQNQHHWRKKHNSVSIGMACSEFMKIISCHPRFQHNACLIVWYCSCCYNLHICLPIRGCRMCRAWIVSWCDMHRLYNWYNAFESCTKTWFFSDSILFILLINQIVYTHCLQLRIISRHNISYHFILYHAISCHIISYQNHTTFFLELWTISMLPPCAFDLCHNFHVPGWSDRKRLGRLGQLHSISFARRVRLGATILDRTCWTEEKRACWSTVGTGHSWNEMPSVGVTALSHHFAKRVVKVGLEGGESWIGQPFWLDEVIWLGTMMIMMRFASESCFAVHGTMDGIFFDCWQCL